MIAASSLIRETQKETAARGEAVATMPCADVLQGLFDTRYTGRIVMDFKDGKIACVNIPSDIKIRVE